MKKRNLLALVLTICLLLPAVVSAAEPGTVTEAVYQMEAMPKGWNPLEERTPEEELLLQLTSDRLYVLSGDGRELTPSLAAALPQDVTADYAGSFGIPAGVDRGYAFLIDLAPDASWEDGSPVSAVDWMFTLNQMIDRKCLDLGLAGLRDYDAGTEMLSDDVTSLKDAGFSSVEEAQEFGYQHFYVDVGHFWGLDAGWVSAQSRTRLKDAAIPSGVTELYVSGAYLFDRYLRTGADQSVFQTEFVGICAEPQYASREDIGLISDDPYRLVLILEQPTTVQTLALKLSALIPLREDLYGEDYGTSMQTYSSCGPWRIAALEAGAVILEPNPCWQGQRQEADRVRLMA